MDSRPLTTVTLLKERVNPIETPLYLAKGEEKNRVHRFKMEKV